MHPSVDQYVAVVSRNGTSSCGVKAIAITRWLTVQPGTILHANIPYTPLATRQSDAKFMVDAVEHFL